MKSLKVYIVTCNDKISYEGYREYKDALKFIKSRLFTSFKKVDDFTFELGSDIFEIHEVIIV